MTPEVILIEPKKKDEPWILQFPKLDTININDPDIQRELITWGLAVGVPGGEFVAKRSFRVIAGENND